MVETVDCLLDRVAFKGSSSRDQRSKRGIAVAGCDCLSSSRRVGSTRPAGRLAIEKQDVSLHTLGVEDSSRKPEQRVNITLMQQLAPDGLASAALKKHIVGNDDGGAAMNLHAALYVLQEVELRTLQ